MIAYTHRSDLKNFWVKYFELYNCVQSEDNRLTHAEIKFIVNLILSENYPYKGDARKEIMKDMGFSSSGFSVNLKRLINKGLVYKENRIYHLRNELKTINSYVKENDNFKISFIFDIDG